MGREDVRRLDLNLLLAYEDEPWHRAVQGQGISCTGRWGPCILTMDEVDEWAVHLSPRVTCPVI